MVERPRTSDRSSEPEGAEDKLRGRVVAQPFARQDMATPAAVVSTHQAQSEFLANVSHELRTPMNAILGMLELSLDERLEDPVRDFLTTAHDSAQGLLVLLNDLLDYARIESRIFGLDAAPFDIREVICSSVKAVSLKAREKGVAFDCRVHEGVPQSLVGDARRIQQIVTNLTSNAAKFTETGEIVVDVSVSSRDEVTAEILLVVSDTGIGIAAADQGRIFEPFTQVDGSTTRKYPGAGLGLSIAEELTKQMNGRLWVDSQLGHGSRFFCTLRLDLPISEAPGVDVPSLAADLAGLPVLVVDDNQDTRTILQAILSSWAMRPVVCSSASDALATLRKAGRNAFRFVILDTSMPDADRLALVDAAHRQGLLQGATVVMLSPGDRQLIRERVDKIGIEACLQKPIPHSGLFEALWAALHGPLPSNLDSELAPQPLRILVAEDTLANQKVVRALLTKHGHVVEVARNGLEALEWLRSQQFDVVLMDVQMPMMDGLQAAAAIRLLPEPQKAAIPIIAMTAQAMPEDREKCLAAGMSDYLPKPIDAVQLLRCVEQHGGRESVGVSWRGSSVPK